MQIDYFERKLDDKRRLTMPTELRQEFASGVVITRGFGNYLHLYPQQVWDREVEAALAGTPQEVTRRGRPAVVVLSSEEYHRLLAGAVKARESFADHLLAFPGGDIERAQVKPRDVSF